MFNFFKKDKKKRPLNDSAAAYLNRFEASLQITYGDSNVRLSENIVWQEIQQLSKTEREDIVIEAFRKLLQERREYTYEPIRRRIFKTEFNAKNPPTKEAILKVFNLLNPFERAYHLPINEIIFSFAYYKEQFGIDEAYLRARNAIVKRWTKSNFYDQEAKFKKLIQGITKLDQDVDAAIPFDQRDALGEYLSAHWNSYPEELKAAITHCWEPPQKAKPTKTWEKQTKKMIEGHTNIDAQVEAIEAIFQFLIKYGKEKVRRLNSPEKQNTGELWSNSNSNYQTYRDYYLLDDNAVGISYLIWYATALQDPRLYASIGALALTFFQKIKNIGSLSTKNGNACLYSFTLMPEKVGITNLLNIRNKTRNKSIRKLVDNHIKRKAEALNLTEEALLELSAPTFNLDGHLSKTQFGDFTGVIDISDLKKPISYWLKNESGKKQKSVPTTVKENYKEELKAFKIQLKEINTNIAIHAKRLENTYLNDIEWLIEDWTKYYIEHPFLSRFTAQLIWWFDDTVSGILYEGQFISNDGKVLDLKDFSKVKIWHPIYSKIEDTAAWRTWIIDKEIHQPFKQAFREVYLVTDAEINTSTYSNRFAAHILYQHQFSALAKLRDWNYNLQGGFDSHNTPSRSIPKFQLRAEYWVDGVNDSINDTGIFSYVTTDQVRIYSGREMLQMQEVPPIVFTEIMRDVDLFVGVCSVGNNPEWEDGGEGGNNYWHNYSFGILTESAQTRKDVLERILPKLKISDRCKIAGKFLVVEGKIRNYKIHLGSGNILMTPNDQYLCIVPDSKPKKNQIFLPFDNDKTLSIILSKAFLLYNDDKIKDTSITRQINL